MIVRLIVPPASGGGNRACLSNGRWRANIGRGSRQPRPLYEIPIQSDERFLTVCRYVEGNAVRANLVERAEEGFRLQIIILQAIVSTRRSPESLNAARLASRVGKKAASGPYSPIHRGICRVPGDSWRSRRRVRFVASRCGAGGCGEMFWGSLNAILKKRGARGQLGLRQTRPPAQPAFLAVATLLRLRGAILEHQHVLQEEGGGANCCGRLARRRLWLRSRPVARP